MTELRRRRKRLNLTLRDVGNYLGCTAVHVADMERGKRNVTPDMARKLCALFGCDESEIFKTVCVRSVLRAKGGDR